MANFNPLRGGAPAPNHHPDFDLDTIDDIVATDPGNRSLLRSVVEASLGQGHDTARNATLLMRALTADSWSVSDVTAGTGSQRTRAGDYGAVLDIINSILSAAAPRDVVVPAPAVAPQPIVPPAAMVPAPIAPQPRPAVAQPQPAPQLPQAFEDDDGFFADDDIRRAIEMSLQDNAAARPASPRRDAADVLADDLAFALSLHEQEQAWAGVVDDRAATWVGRETSEALQLLERLRSEYGLRIDTFSKTQLREFLGNEVQMQAAGVHRVGNQQNAGSVEPPAALLCPRSGAVFTDPVLCVDGRVYDRSQVLAGDVLDTCRTMRSVTDAWNESRNDFARLGTRLAEALTCPISADVMVEPVSTSDGFTYERGGIELYLQGAIARGAQHVINPVTRQPLANTNLLRNETVSDLLEQLRGDARFPQFTVSERPVFDQNPVPPAAQPEVELVEILDLIMQMVRPTVFTPDVLIASLRVLEQLEIARANLPQRALMQHREFAVPAAGLIQLIDMEFETDQNSLSASLVAGHLFRLLGQNEVALTSLNAVVQHPSFADAPVEALGHLLGWRALTLANLEQYDQAAVQASAVLLVDPSNPHALAALGEVYRKAHRYQEARSLLELSLQRLPTREARESLTKVRTSMRWRIVR